jgi:hypothetical protein
MAAAVRPVDGVLIKANEETFSSCAAGAFVDDRRRHEIECMEFRQVINNVKRITRYVQTSKESSVSLTSARLCKYYLYSMTVHEVQETAARLLLSILNGFMLQRRCRQHEVIAFAESYN